MISSILNWISKSKKFKKLWKFGKNQKNRKLERYFCLIFSLNKCLPSLESVYEDIPDVGVRDLQILFCVAQDFNQIFQRLLAEDVNDLALDAWVLKHLLVEVIHQLQGAGVDGRGGNDPFIRISFLLEIGDGGFISL